MVLPQELRAYIFTRMGKRDDWEHQESFERAKSTPSGTPASTRLHPLILPKQFHHLKPNIQIDEPMGAILFQTTTVNIMTCVLPLYPFTGDGDLHNFILCKHLEASVAVARFQLNFKSILYRGTEICQPVGRL